VTEFAFMSLLHLIDVAKNSWWDANSQNRQLADRFMPGAPRNVDHDAVMKDVTFMLFSLIRARFSAGDQVPPQDKDPNRRLDPTQIASDGRRGAIRHDHRG
jgi:hypothetical protein